MNAEKRTRRIMQKVEDTVTSPMSSNLSDLFAPTGRDQIVRDIQGCWLARFTPRYLQVSNVNSNNSESPERE